MTEYTPQPFPGRLEINLPMDVFCKNDSVHSPRSSETILGLLRTISYRIAITRLYGHKVVITYDQSKPFKLCAYYTVTQAISSVCEQLRGPEDIQISGNLVEDITENSKRPKVLEFVLYAVQTAIRDVELIWSHSATYMDNYVQQNPLRG